MSHAPAAPTDPNLPRGDTRRGWHWGAFASLLAVLVYLPSLGNGFVIDDHRVVEQHPVILGTAPWWTVLDYDHFGFHRTAATTIGVWRPLLTLSLAWDQRVGGGAAWVFHLTNALLHGAVTATLFAMVRAATANVRLAAIAAALFAVHTLHTDAVLAVVQRGELLSALLSMLALAAHRKGGRSDALAVLAYAAALASKESSVLLLPLLLMHDVIWRRPRTARRAAVFAAYVAVTGVVVWLRWRVCGSLRGFASDAVMNPLRELPVLQQRVTALRLMGHAVTQLIAPVDLLHEYGAGVFPLRPMLDGRLLLGAATLAGSLALAWRERARAPWISYAAAVFALSLSAVCSLLGLYSVMYAERLVYLASAPAAALAAAGIEWIGARRRVSARVGVAALVAALSAMTVRRCADWRDDETLLRASLETNANSAWALTALGVSRQRVGALGEAIALCEAAAQRAPGYALAWGCAGSARAQAGDWVGAERAFRRMTRGTWTEAAFEENYVRLLLAQRRPREALARLRWMQSHDLRSPGVEALLREAREAVAAQPDAAAGPR